MPPVSLAKIVQTTELYHYCDCRHSMMIAVVQNSSKEAGFGQDAVFDIVLAVDGYDRALAD